MKILLDTHMFLWAIAEPEKLSKRFREQLEVPTNTIYVSAVTVAELMIKASIGKLVVDFNPAEIAVESGFELLDFSAEDALLLRELPFHHRDPFDRMLIVQSQRNKLRLMSVDAKVALYGCAMV